MIDIRAMTASDHPAVLRLVSALPEWFDEHARGISIPTDIQHQTGFVAVSGAEVVGFINLYVADGRLHIGWLGVAPRAHRQGVGRLLLERAEEHARELGIAELATYTLGDSVDYEPYERTRRFYAACGFRVYQRSQTDNPGCPEEIRLVKEVGLPGQAGGGSGQSVK
jgi:GNAT superfamily N-acetyltransferase